MIFDEEDSGLDDKGLCFRELWSSSRVFLACSMLFVVFDEEDAGLEFGG